MPNDYTIPDHYFNRQGRLNALAFQNGQTEFIDNKPFYTVMFLKDGIYHIRTTRYADTQRGHFSKWDTALSLTAARKVLARHIKHYHRHVTLARTAREPIPGDSRSEHTDIQS